MTAFRIRMDSNALTSWVGPFGRPSKTTFFLGCWRTTNPKEAREWPTRQSATKWLMLRMLPGVVEPVPEITSVHAPVDLTRRLREVEAQRDDALAKLAAVLAAKPPQRKPTKSKGRKS